ncbi:MAG: hypothetical protein PHY99_10580 [Bacteroidales bacterium]|nr:hypothetical protein [Bacteroidales bacterium]
MKKFAIISLFIGIGAICSAQIVLNPNIAIKPIATLSITQVVTKDSTTSVTIKIANAKGMTPFTLRTRDLFIRPVSDPNGYNLIRAEKAPFAPEKHQFTSANETFEFTLIFKALPKGTKYFDLMENMPKKEFYIQGVILDPKLNEIVTRGFDCFSKADGNGALKAFIEMANADLYFEYGMAYFNIIYILTLANRIPEAKEWYKKFQDRFFYDKALLEKEMTRLGIKDKLK